ncbi:MAG: DUF1501 domain-containing protein [Myxococcota bacterium]
MNRLSRRDLLRGFLGGAAALSVGPAAHLLAQGSMQRRFVSFYFNGGWDVLLGPDPRDPSRTYSDLHTGAESSRPLLPAEWREPIPVRIGEDREETILGRTMESLVEHCDVLTLFRGVNMNTVAHPTGRAYVNTFQAPAGVVPRGDSLGTKMAAGTDPSVFVLPNMSIGMPTFNESQDPTLTGTRIGRATQMRDLLVPRGRTLPSNVEALLDAARRAESSCVDARYDGALPLELAEGARDRLRLAVERDLGAAFDLGSDMRLQTEYGITNPNDGNDPAVVAATVYRLFETGLSSSVSAQLQNGLDDHGSEWANDQPRDLKEAFDALAALLRDLRRDDPMLEQTMIVCHSEFARTPRINGNGGRDHWFSNSILAFGGGLKHGVFGASVEDSLGLLAVDPVTGRPSETGEVILPERIGATLLAAQGLDPYAFRTTPLDAWLA